MSFIIILSCNSVARSICTLLTVFVIYVNHFHQKANKQPLGEKKEKKSQGEIRGVYMMREWKQQLPLPIY